MPRMSLNRAKVIVYQVNQIKLQLELAGKKLTPKAAANLRAAEERIEEGEDWGREQLRARLLERQDRR